jgi:hypothetical protein
MRPVLPVRVTNVQRCNNFGATPLRGRGYRKLRQGIVRGGNLEWSEMPDVLRTIRANPPKRGALALEKFNF